MAQDLWQRMKNDDLSPTRELMIARMELVFQDFIKTHKNDDTVKDPVRHALFAAVADVMYSVACALIVEQSDNFIPPEL